MNRVLPDIGHLVTDDQGQDLVEYGLLAMLIAVAAMAAVRVVGQTIHTVFWEVIQNGL